MNGQTPQAILESPQTQHASPPAQPQQISPSATTPSSSTNITTPLQSPQVLQVAGPGQHQHSPNPTAKLTGQYIAPQPSPQLYQYPPSDAPPQFQYVQKTINGTMVNPSLNGHHMQHVTTMPNQNLPALPPIVHYPGYTQPQGYVQSPTRDLPQNFPTTGDKNNGLVQVQGVFTAQPEQAKGMEYIGMSEEELKKQRRAEKIAKARHCAGETCIITGKICVVTCSVMAAACSVLSCFLNCIPGDSPGMMGGDSGFNFGAD